MQFTLSFLREFIMKSDPNLPEVIELLYNMCRELQASVLCRSNIPAISEEDRQDLRFIPNLVNRVDHYLRLLQITDEDFWNSESNFGDYFS